MFDKEFFPTPKHVLESISIDCYNKIVLEPSAGKGDIVDYLKNNGAKSVLAVEKNDDLRTILESKCKVIGSDFFDITAEQISHVQLMVINPPFSNAEKHIQHAWEVAPEGCEVISLCNYETISKTYRYTQLSKLIQNYGISENLGSCFDTAERKTNVEIGLIRLFKPIISSESEFSGFFMEEEEESKNTTEGVMPFDEVRALVQRYIGAMKTFDKLKLVLDELEYTTGVLGMKNFELNLGYNNSVTTREEFSKSLLKKSWNYIINKSGIRKFTTSLMLEDINRFVEQQEKIPFTMKNVYHMLDMIVQTRQQQFDKALVLAIDKFTEHIKENRYGVEGWHTNLGHMINKKIIVPDLFERGWNNANYVSVRHNSHYLKKLDDLVKVSCVICGYVYEDMGSIYRYKPSHLETGIWYDWGFFEFKCFYKGTMHIKFKNLDDWARINRAYGEIKGFTVPEKF